MRELLEAYAAEGKVRKEAIQARRNSAKAKVNSPSKQGYVDDNEPVRISAVFSDTMLSLSGRGVDLQHIQAFLRARGLSADCRWAHIHAVYHQDSPQSQAAVNTVLSDVERRKIAFPGWASLHAPVLSCADGRHMSPSSNGLNSPDGSNPSTPTTSLLEQALRNIFTERVEWKTTSSNLRDSIAARLQSDSSAAYCVLGVGPGTRFLLDPLLQASSHSPLPGLTVVEDAAMYAAPAPDDIAVVGLSVNVPGAKGQEAFWRLIEAGLSTVGEVRRLNYPYPSFKRERKGRKRICICSHM